VTGTVPTTDGLDPALCEGDVCAVPTAPDAPGGVLPLAAPPAT
jgi:hypothetical protein